MNYFRHLARLITWTIATCVLCASALGQTADNGLNELVFKALREGQASGEVFGEIAQMYRQQFKSHAPVTALVTTVQQFKRKDCRRLNIKLDMPGVTIKDTKGTPHPVTMDIKLNVCSDGLPPAKHEM